MALVVDWGRYVAVDCGDEGIKLDGTAGACSPALPGGILAWSYTVPTGSKVTLESLAVAIYNGAWGANANNPAVAVDGGTIKIRQASVDKFEDRLLTLPEPRNSLSGDETVNGASSWAQCWDFGDGMIFASGALLEWTITPVAASIGAGVVYWVSAFGTTGGVPDVRCGRLVPYLTTANQAVLSFTPAADYTLLGFQVSTHCSGSVIGALRLELDGATILETPPQGMAEMDPVFSSRDPVTPGILWLPLEGLELQQGQRLALYCHPWVDAGHQIAVQLTGTTTAYSGTGGGGEVAHTFVL